MKKYNQRKREVLSENHSLKNGKNINTGKPSSHTSFNPMSSSTYKTSGNFQNKKDISTINTQEEVQIKNQVNKNEGKKLHNDKKIEHKLMDNLFNEVERCNAKNILKGDLAEIYDEIIKENSDFKENIFFVNLNHYENLIGNCDKNIIPHSYKDYRIEELLQKKYFPAKELYKKYDNKAKVIKEKNESNV